MHPKLQFERRFFWFGFGQLKLVWFINTFVAWVGLSFSLENSCRKFYYPYLLNMQNYFFYYFLSISFFVRFSIYLFLFLLKDKFIVTLHGDKSCYKGNNNDTVYMFNNALLLVLTTLGCRLTMEFSILVNGNSNEQRGNVSLL